MKKANDFYNERIMVITKEEQGLDAPFIAIMKEFAKLHVTAALEAASKEDLNCECDSWERCHNKMPVNDILNSYPLTNIL